MVLLGAQEDEVSSYLKTTDVLPLLEAGVEAMLDECVADPKKAKNAGAMLAQWLRDHNPRRDPEMAAKLGSMRAELEAEAKAAAEMYEGAVKVQAGLRGRQARLHAKGKAADAVALKKLEEEAAAADEAVAAATRVQAGIRGRQARARLSSKEEYVPAAAEAAADKAAAVTAEEVQQADEAAAAATRVQASIRGRQARAVAKAKGLPVDAPPAGEVEEQSAEELEAEAKAADEAVAAATKVQAGIRGRQARAKSKKAE